MLRSPLRRRWPVLFAAGSCAVLAAIATPGGDLVSPFALGGTMYLLYELTVQFIKRTGR